MPKVYPRNRSLDLLFCTFPMNITNFKNFNTIFYLLNLKSLKMSTTESICMLSKSLSPASPTSLAKYLQMALDWTIFLPSISKTGIWPKGMAVKKGLADYIMEFKYSELTLLGFWPIFSIVTNVLEFYASIIK